VAERRGLLVGDTTGRGDARLRGRVPSLRSGPCAPADPERLGQRSRVDAGRPIL